MKTFAVEAMPSIQAIKPIATSKRPTTRRPVAQVVMQAPAPLPRRPAGKAVAVLAVQDEAHTLPAVLQEIGRAGLRCVVVVNGSRDGTARVARAANCRVIEYQQPIGHDVGRAIGAAAVEADAYLFLDGDIRIRAEELMPFLAAVAGGVDVALNDLRAWARGADAVSQAKLFLNRAMGRADLGVSSLTAVPHALSRRAVQTIGATRLAVPPLAQAVAVLEGLRVQAVHPVDVVSTNRQHPSTSPARSPSTVQDMILGDHLEALQYIIARRGARGGLTDGQRKRALLASLSE